VKIAKPKFELNSVHLAVVMSSAATAAASVFIPLLARQLGISYADLGIVSASFWAGAIISYYLFGWLADATGRKSALIKVGLALSCIAFLAQFFIADFFSFTAIRFLAGFATGIYAYSMVAAASSLPKYKKEIGLLSAFGSLGWFLGYVFASLLGDARILFVASGAMYLVAFLASTRMASLRHVKKSLPLNPLNLLRKNKSVYLTYFLRHLGANAVWLIQPLFLQQLGASEFWIGAIMAVNVLAQFFLMKWVGQEAQKGALDEKKLVRQGAIVAGALFALYPFIPNFYFAIAIQLMIAVSWSFMYVGSMIRLASTNSEKAASAGLLGSVLSLSTILGAIAGGLLAQQFGMLSTFAFAVLLCGASFLASKEI